MISRYGKSEIACIELRDKRLGEVIDLIGHVRLRGHGRSFVSQGNWCVDGGNAAFLFLRTSRYLRFWRLFEKYRRCLSPYGSIASLYLWEVAGGMLPDITDPAAP